MGSIGNVGLESVCTFGYEAGRSASEIAGVMRLMAVTAGTEKPASDTHCIKQ